MAEDNKSTPVKRLPGQSGAPTPLGTASIGLSLGGATVTLTLAQPVACPGHPLAITATGTPAGGNFSWTITGAAGADLVDGGGASVRTGSVVNLLGFQPDPGTGNIPAQTAVISVDYTLVPYPIATASQNVTIHAINFVVTKNVINKNQTRADIGSSSQFKIGSVGTPTVSTDPQVQIQLDASCPRKSDCAGNHRAGWLQTVLSNTAILRYTDTKIEFNIPIPIRDDFGNSPPPPFYLAPVLFAGDKDAKTVHHEDTPDLPGGWTDPRSGAPAKPPPPDGGGPAPPSKNLELRQASRAMTFTAWLVVQNVEWSAHDMAGSLAFLANFNWGMSLSVTVDTSKKDLKTRATPVSSNPTVPKSFSTGKGGSSPNLATPTADQALNDPANMHIDPAPTLP
jgi:hypothetical protein